MKGREAGKPFPVTSSGSSQTSPVSSPAQLVAVGAPRLRRSGIDVPGRGPDRAEHRLYALLARSGPDSAHSRYNALIRRLVSFERAIAGGGAA